MKPLKRQYQIFVREMNKHGDHTKAYQKAYPSAKATTARVQAYYLLQNPTIAKKIKTQSDKIDTIAIKEAAQELKDQIVYEVLTATRKKELLRLISEGKIMHKILRPFFNAETEKWESTVFAISEPSLMDRLKAIELHNRMTGDNAPDKIAQTDTEGNTVTIFQLPDNDRNHKASARLPDDGTEQPG